MKVALVYTFSVNEITLPEFEISVHSFAKHNKFNTNIVVYTDHPEYVWYRTRNLKYNNINFIVKGMKHFHTSMYHYCDKQLYDNSVSNFKQDHSDNSFAYLDYMEIITAKMLGIIECISEYDVVISQDIDTMYFRSVNIILGSLYKSSYAMCGVFCNYTDPDSGSQIRSSDTGCMVFVRKNLPTNLYEMFDEFLKAHLDGRGYVNFDERFIGQLSTKYPVLFQPYICFYHCGYDNAYLTKQFYCLHFHISSIQRIHVGLQRFRAHETIMLMMDEYLKFADEHNVKTENKLFSAWLIDMMRDFIKFDGTDIETYFERVIHDDVKSQPIYKEKLEWWKKKLDFE